MMPLQVGDLDHNYVRFGRLGTFAVTIDPSQVGEVPAEPAAMVADDRFEMIDGQLKLRPGRSLAGKSGPTANVLITVPDTSSPQHENPLQISVSVQSALGRNPIEPLDVDGDGDTDPLDALLIINEINTGMASVRRLVPSGTHVSQPFRDVDGDHDLSPLDALLVINEINRPHPPKVLGEGEADTAGHDNAPGGNPPAESILMMRAGDVIFAAQGRQGDVVPTMPVRALMNAVTIGMAEPPIGFALRNVPGHEEIWAELESQGGLVGLEELLSAMLDSDMTET